MQALPFGSVVSWWKKRLLLFKLPIHGVYIIRALFSIMMTFMVTWFWGNYRFALMLTSSIVSYLDINYFSTGVLVFME